MRDSERGEPTVFELWSKYEDIAMHFNTLLIQFRVQVLGGVAVTSTVAGVLIEKVQNIGDRNAILALSFGSFAAIWAGLAGLDLFYYRRLLRGAVQAIGDLEAKPDAPQLSGVITQAVGRGGIAAWVFYGVVEVVLLVVFAWALSRVARG